MRIALAFVAAVMLGGCCSATSAPAPQLTAAAYAPAAPAVRTVTARPVSASYDPASYDPASYSPATYASATHTPGTYDPYARGVDYAGGQYTVGQVVETREVASTRAVPMEYIRASEGWAYENGMIVPVMPAAEQPARAASASPCAPVDPCANGACDVPTMDCSGGTCKVPGLFDLGCDPR